MKSYKFISVVYPLIFSLSLNPYSNRLAPIMLLVANFFQYKMIQKPEKCLEPWHMGAHLRVLSESYPINTNNIMLVFIG